MSRFVPVSFEKWGEMVKAQSDLVRYKEMCDELDAECTRLKAEVDRLQEEKKLPFAYGGKQLLVDLNKLLTAHRKYCDINRIDYTQMERDALS